MEYTNDPQRDVLVNVQKRLENAKASRPEAGVALAVVNKNINERGDEWKRTLVSLQQWFVGGTEEDNISAIKAVFDGLTNDDVARELLHQFSIDIRQTRNSTLDQLTQLFSHGHTAGARSGMFSFVDTLGNGNCFYNAVHQLLATPKPSTLTSSEAQFGLDLKANLVAWLTAHKTSACGYIERIPANAGVRPLPAANLTLEGSEVVVGEENLTLLNWTALHGAHFFFDATNASLMVRITQEHLNLNSRTSPEDVQNAYTAATTEQRFDIMAATIRTNRFWAGPFHIVVCATYLQRNIVVLNAIDGMRKPQIRYYYPVISYANATRPLQTLYIMQTENHFQALFVHEIDPTTNSPTDQAASATVIYNHLLRDAFERSGDDALDLVLVGLEPDHSSPAIDLPDIKRKLFADIETDSMGVIRESGHSTKPYWRAREALRKRAMSEALRDQWSQATRYNEPSTALTEMNAFWSSVCEFMDADSQTTRHAAFDSVHTETIGSVAPHKSPPQLPSSTRATPVVETSVPTLTVEIGEQRRRSRADTTSSFAVRSQRYTNALLPFVNLLRLFYMSTSVGGTRPPQYLQALQYDHSLGERDLESQVYVSPNGFGEARIESSAEFMEFSMKSGYLPTTGHVLYLGPSERGSFARLLDEYAQRDAASVYEKRNASSATVMLLHDEAPDLSMLLLAYPTPENLAERDVLAPPEPYYVITHADTLRPLYGGTARHMFSSRAEFEKYVRDTGFAAYFVYQDDMHRNALTTLTAKEVTGMAPDRISATDDVQLSAMRPTTADGQLYVVAQWLEIYNSYAKYALDTEAVTAPLRRTEADRLLDVLPPPPHPTLPAVRKSVHNVSLWLLAGGRNMEALYVNVTEENTEEVFARIPLTLPHPLTDIFVDNDLDTSRSIGEAFSSTQSGLIQNGVTAKLKFGAAVKIARREVASQAFYSMIGSKDGLLHIVYPREEKVFRMEREGLLAEGPSYADFSSSSDTFLVLRLTSSADYMRAYTRLGWTSYDAKRPTRYTCVDTDSYARFRLLYVDVLDGVEPERVFAECAMEALRAAPIEATPDDVLSQVLLNSMVRAASVDWKLWREGVSTKLSGRAYSSVYVAFATLLDARISTRSAAEAQRQMHNLLYSMVYARSDAFGTRTGEIFQVQLGNYDETVRLLVGCNWVLRFEDTVTLDPLAVLVVTPRTRTASTEEGAWARAEAGFHSSSTLIVADQHTAEVEDRLQRFTHTGTGALSVYERTDRYPGQRALYFDDVQTNVAKITSAVGSSFWRSISPLSSTSSSDTPSIDSLFGTEIPVSDVPLKSTLQIASVLRRNGVSWNDGPTVFNIESVLAGKTLVGEFYTPPVRTTTVELSYDMEAPDTYAVEDEDPREQPTPEVLSTAPSTRNITGAHAIPIALDLRQSVMPITHAFERTTITVAVDPTQDKSRGQLIVRRTPSDARPAETRKINRENIGYVFYGDVPISMIDVGAATRKTLLAHLGVYDDAAISEFMRQMGAHLFRFQGHAPRGKITDETVRKVFTHFTTNPGKGTNPNADNIPTLIAHMHAVGSRTSLTTRSYDEQLADSGDEKSLFNARYRAFMQELNAPQIVDFSEAFSADQRLSGRDALALIWFMHRKKNNAPFSRKYTSLEKHLYQVLPRSGSKHLFSSFFDGVGNLRTFRSENNTSSLNSVSMRISNLNLNVLTTRHYVEMSVPSGDIWYAVVGASHVFPASSVSGTESFAVTNRVNLLIPEAVGPTRIDVANMRANQLNAATAGLQGDSMQASSLEHELPGRQEIVKQMNGASDLRVDYATQSAFVRNAQIRLGIPRTAIAQQTYAVYWTPAHTVMHWLMTMYRDLDWKAVADSIKRPPIVVKTQRGGSLTGYHVPSEDSETTLSQVENVLVFLDRLSSRPPVKEAAQEAKLSRNRTLQQLERMVEVAFMDKTSRAHMMAYYAEDGSLSGEHNLFFSHLQAIVGAELFYDDARPAEDARPSTYNTRLQSAINVVLNATSGKTPSRVHYTESGNAPFSTKLGVPSDMEFYAPIVGYVAPGLAFKHANGMIDSPPEKHYAGKGKSQHAAFVRVGQRHPSIRVLGQQREVPSTAAKREDSSSSGGGYYPIFSVVAQACVGASKRVGVFLRGVSSGDVSLYDAPQWCLVAEEVIEKGALLDSVAGVTWFVEVEKSPQQLQAQAAVDFMTLLYNDDATPVLVPTGEFSWAAYLGGALDHDAEQNPENDDVDIRHFVVEVDARHFSNRTRYVRYTVDEERANVEFVQHSPSAFSINMHRNTSYQPGLDNSINVWQDKLSMWSLRTTRQVRSEEELLVYYDVEVVGAFNTMMQARKSDVSAEGPLRSMFPILQPRMHHPEDLV